MRFPSRQQRTRRVLLLACLLFAAVFGRPASAADNRLVGQLGDPKLLQFKGTKTMPAQRVRDELQRDWEVEVAATPSAPLDEYLATLQRRLIVGYQASGFPNAKIEVVTNPEKSAILVNVEEGQRCLAGDVKITGTKSVDTAAIIKELTSTLPTSNFPTQSNPANGVLSVGYWQDNLETPKPAWEVGKPPGFDPLSIRRLHRDVVEAFLRHGYFWLKCDVKPIVQGDKAVLAIDVVSEGRPAQLDRVEIVGNRKNTVTDIVRYLKLEKGTLIDLAQMRTIQQRLWNSARFLRHTVAAVIDKNNPGRCYLHIEVEEAAAAPPLNTPLSAAEQTVLKTSDLLNKLMDAPDDQVISLTRGEDDLRVIVGHDQGVAITLAPTKAATQPTFSAPASLVMTSRDLGIVFNGHKFITHPLASGMVVSIHMVPLFDQQAGKSQQNFAAAANFETRAGPTDAPLRLRIAVAPVSLLLAAHPEKGTSQVKDGILVITSPDQVFRIDAATGRLLQFYDIPHHSTLTLSSAKAALESEIKTLESSAPTNQCDPKRVAGSFVGFVGEWLAVSDYLTSKVPPPQRQVIASAVQKLLTPTLFAPLDEMSDVPAVAQGDVFALPTNPERVVANGMYGRFALVAIPFCDEIFVRGGWPWTIARESFNVFAGNSTYTNREIARLYGANDIGPIGYLASARLLTFADPPLARAFAQKGLESLTLESFQKDCRSLILNDSIAAKIAIQFIANARRLSDEETKAVAAVLNPTVAAILVEMAQKIQTTEKPTPQGTADLLRDSWESSLKSKVEAALTLIAQAPLK